MMAVLSRSLPSRFSMPTRWRIVALLGLLIGHLADALQAEQKLHQNRDKRDPEERIMHTEYARALPLIFKHENLDIRPLNGSRDFDYVGHGGLGVVFKGLYRSQAAPGQAGSLQKEVAIKIMPQSKHLARKSWQSVHADLDEDVNACATVQGLRWPQGRNVVHPAGERVIDCIWAHKYTDEDDMDLGVSAMAIDLSTPGNGGRWALVLHVLEWAGIESKQTFARRQKEHESAAKIILMARQMLLALSHIHSVHRAVLDLKFSNMCVVEEIFGYPVIKLIDMEGVQKMTPKVAAQGHTATAPYFDRYMLMMQEKKKNFGGRHHFRYNFFCGVDESEFPNGRFPPEVSPLVRHQQFCPSGHAQDIWSVGMSLLKYLCDVKHFPLKPGQTDQEAAEEWEKLDSSANHMHDRFPTSFWQFVNWIKTSSTRTDHHKYRNHCATFTDAQLDTLWQMLRPEPWKRKEASELLKMELFNMTAAAKAVSEADDAVADLNANRRSGANLPVKVLSKNGFYALGASPRGNQDREGTIGTKGFGFAMAPLLESRDMDTVTFLRYKEILCKPILTHWKADKKEWLPHRTWLEADARGLKLLWLESNETANVRHTPRYLHLGYIGRVGFNLTDPSKLTIKVNRTNPDCKNKMDKSCKHPIDPDSSPQKRTIPLEVGFPSAQDAADFAEALRKLADLQKNNSPLPFAAPDSTLSREMRSEKKKKGGANKGNGRGSARGSKQVKQSAFQQQRQKPSVILNGR